MIQIIVTIEEADGNTVRPARNHPSWIQRPYKRNNSQAVPTPERGRIRSRHRPIRCCSAIMPCPHITAFQEGVLGGITSFILPKTRAGRKPPESGKPESEERLNRRWRQRVSGYKRSTPGPNCHGPGKPGPKTVRVKSHRRSTP